MVRKIKLTNLRKASVKAINSIHLPNWLILILVLVLLLRVPSFFEPYSYGDETIYLSLGEAVRSGKVLYRDIHDNKPPLLYFLAAVSGNLFWFKALLAFWSAVTIILFWKLVQALFPQKTRLHKISTLIFALLTTLPLLEGNIANAENFMIGLSLGAFLILFTQKLNFRNIFLAGVLFSLAALFKIPAVFELPVIILYWLIINNLRDLKEIIKRTLYLVLGFSVPIGATFIWYFLRGAFNDYLISGFLENFGYLSTFRPEDVAKPFLIKNGPLLIRGAIVLSGALTLFIFRKKLSKQYVFLTLWLLFTLFAVTLSERPYPHYLLQTTPPISVMLAMLFTFPTIEQALVILPLTLALLVPVTFKFWYYSTTAYYERFLSFVSGQISKEQYLAKFGSHVPRSYKIAEFLVSSTTKSDAVFVWGPESQTVYALARRFPPFKYIAEYHINDFSSPDEVANAVGSKLPKIIVVLPGAPDFKQLTEIIDKDYLQINEIDEAKIYMKSRLGSQI